MPRFPRIVVADVPMHIVQRGNDRMATFHCHEDFVCYLAILRDVSRLTGCPVHAYVLMTNHVHLLVTPGDESAPARMMQKLGARYVRYFNHRHGRTGTLWEGRYKSTPVDNGGYFFTCSRYIELNPVRAGMVSDPDEYRWSSFRRNALGASDALVTSHRVYDLLDRTAAKRCLAYASLFAEDIAPDTLDAIRKATWTGDPLGSVRFRAELEATLERPLARLQHGGDRRSEQFRSSQHGEARGVMLQSL
jgi:putative transposase